MIIVIPTFGMFARHLLVSPQLTGCNNLRNYKWVLIKFYIWSSNACQLNPIFSPFFYLKVKEIGLWDYHGVCVCVFVSLSVSVC